MIGFVGSLGNGGSDGDAFGACFGLILCFVSDLNI